MKSRFSNGFALPAVLMSSIVMLIVMLAAVTSTVSSRVSLESQYYNQLSKTAGEAGVAYAKACMAQNSGTPQWTDAKPLKPYTDCSGNQLSGFTCSDNSTDPRCSVSVINGNIITSFSVPVPLPDTTGAFTNISSNGSVSMLRSSGGDVWRQYQQKTKTIKQTVNGASEIGWKQSENGHWKQIAVGYYHTCAIASNDQAYCWGWNTGGQLGNNSTTNSAVPVAVDTSGVLNGLIIKSISTGYSHTCAIASNDQAYCWGQNNVGLLGNNSTAQSNIPVAVTTTGALNGLTVKSISAGNSQTCAIASNDQAYCWGYNSFGELGNNSTTNSAVPVAVTTTGVLNGLTVKSISVGDNNVCAIASNNNVYCWGYNFEGELGNSLSTNSAVPVAVTTTGVLNGLTVKSFSSNYRHTCVVASNNNAYCWGQNTNGQLGNSSSTNSAVPVAVTTTGVLNGLTVKSISAGYAHTCIVASNDKAYCWGDDTYGQLGDGTNNQSNVPTAVVATGSINGLTISSISAGRRFHTCVTASNDQIYCWGNNTYGQLGNNSTTGTTVPVAITSSAVLNSLTTQTITAGNYRTCSIASNDQAYCWGRNNYGQLGNNATSDSMSPVAVNMTGVLNGLSIRSIDAGSFGHTCVIASNNQAYCWGINDVGELGNASTTNSSVPVAINSSGVLSGLTIKSISVGYIHTCVIASNDQAYCWGSGGRLGNNSSATSLVPVAVNTSGVLSGLTIKSISAGAYHTCAIASNDKVYCWGDNDYGGLGNGSTVASLVPVAVDTSGVLSGLTIKAISAGGSYTCAIASNDKVYCWGYNGSGRLGNGSSVNSLVPVAVDTSGVLSGLTIKAISAGNYHICAIASNNLPYCWGYAYYGELGNNSTNDSNIPVSVTMSGVLNGLNIKSITARDGHTCVIADNSKVYCWGKNDYGQLGNNLTSNSSVPVFTNSAIGFAPKSIWASY